MGEMTNSTRVPVLSYHEYMGRDGQTVHGTRVFCGACRRGLGGVYGSAYFGYPEYPEDIEAKNDSPHGLLPLKSGRELGLELEYFAFCPWCGAAFEDEWWKNKVVQNERAIDHYQNPGTHKGDTHEFRGDRPDCFVNHYLGVSGGQVCWCDPEIEPGLMGCVIRHRDVSYDDYLARSQEAAAAFDDEDDE